MSWSRAYKSLDDFDKDVPSSGTFDVVAESPDVQEQVDAARKAAKILINSRAIISGQQDVTVSISGHANPGHKPSSNMANDFITITVYQKG